MLHKFSISHKIIKHFNKINFWKWYTSVFYVMQTTHKIYTETIFSGIFFLLYNMCLCT